MSIFKNYQPEERPRIAAGNYRVEIVDVDDKPSKKGSAMITVTYRLNTVNFRIKDYFVEGSMFLNADLTEFYTCFGIDLGDQMIRTWVGATGVVGIKEDGQYMRIGQYLAPDSKAALAVPAWEGPMPERQTITTLAEQTFGGADQDEDELPF